jgi:hypothetical protein
MALKGERKRAYQKQYMRRQRAADRRLTIAEINQRLKELGFSGQPAPHPKPIILSLSNASTARQVDRLCYEDWRRIA